MACGCEGKKYNIGFGCCQPVLGPVEQYYTKYQIDEMLDEIESAITSGCCITPEEVDEKIDEATSGLQQTLSAGTGIDITDNIISCTITGSGGCDCDFSDYYTKSETNSQISSATADMATKTWVGEQGYLTEHQHLKTLNGESLVGDGNITISGDCDLTEYVTFDDMSSYVGDVYTKTEVNNLFVTKQTFNTYIINLQQQIDSLKEAISGCCGSSGETGYRWITVPNDYVCSGTTKMTKEKQQSSTDGINWTDTGQYRTGSTVLENNSVDCGYEGCVVLSAYTLSGDIITPNNSEQVEGTLSTKSTLQGNMYNNRETITSITVSNCVNIVGTYAGHYLFGGYTVLSNVILPSSITRIHPNALVCSSITSITCLATTPPFMSNGYHYFYTGGSLKIYVPSASVNAYKAADGWSQYADLIMPIQ